MCITVTQCQSHCSCSRWDMWNVHFRQRNSTWNVLQVTVCGVAEAVLFVLYGGTLQWRTAHKHPPPPALSETPWPLHENLYFKSQKNQMLFRSNTLVRALKIDLKAPNPKCSDRALQQEGDSSRGWILFSSLCSFDRLQNPPCKGNSSQWKKQIKLEKNIICVDLG